MIVIDVGCARIGGDYSVERLLEWYHPDILYGFDPAKDVAKAMPSTIPPGGNMGAVVILERMAAWTYDGEIGYREDGLSSWVTYDPEAQKVRCIDLARFIDELPPGPVILKLDAEGAEYEILQHLILRGTVARLDRVLVEWHTIPDPNAPKRRHGIEMALRQWCPVEQWRW